MPKTKKKGTKKSTKAKDKKTDVPEDVPKKSSFVRTVLNILIFLFELPLRIYNTYIDWHAGKIKEEQIKEIEKKRDSIKAGYERFREIETIKGSFDRLEKDLFSSDSMIGIILGARGRGKTAVGIKILENAYAITQKKCYAIGFHANDLPKWIEPVLDVSEIKNDAFVLIDEGGILFSARNAMTTANKLLSDLILVARHKNLTILFISQNSANLDINILRQADFLILKPSSLLQKDFERKKIKDIYEEVKDKFSEYDDHKGLTYFYSDHFTGFVDNPLPTFWNIKISKSFK